MAYACPVCDTVEADAEHLANHLAVTASLHESEHAAWLEEHAPDWAERSPAELGATAIDHAEERSPEDTVHTHDNGEGPLPDMEYTHPDPAVEPGGQMDAETERALRKARELMESDDDAEG